MRRIENKDMQVYTGGRKCYLYTGEADNRKSYDGLSALVEVQMNKRPQMDEIYVFFIKGRSHVRLLMKVAEGIVLHEFHGERAMEIKRACLGLVH